MIKLAILASGSGSNAEKIMEHFQGSTQAEIALIASNKAEAYVLERAKKVGVPSFTFSSGASSIVAAGATPVFVDIEGDSGNIDPALVEAAITPKTKAISVMHYGGQPVDMDAINRISKPYGIPVLEDNAQIGRASCRERV
jgi:dTDP-4-amino-4,6-dideoxygalactose transaminase